MSLYQVRMACQSDDIPKPQAFRLAGTDKSHHRPNMMYGIFLPFTI